MTDRLSHCAVSLLALASAVVTPSAAAPATHKVAASKHSRAVPPAPPVSVPADPYAGGVPVRARRFGLHCTINSVPTPADANLRSPYAAYVFDGNVQAFVPPVPPGYKGPIRIVQQEICKGGF
jgi:hypothetical protein